jgi:ribosomal protein S12 methylthiotransferase
MQNQKFHLISLGCAKNTVDSESMAQLLGNSDYIPVPDPSQANVLIVNTCGFIGPAKEESLNTLKELAAQKRADQI